MSADDPPDTLDQLVADLGVAGRRLGDAIDGVLAGDDLAAIVQRSGLARRTVERLLRIGAERAALVDLRATIGSHAVSSPEPGAEAVARMQALIDAAPAATRHLDHVSATAETAARRAEWLAARFVLDGRRLVLAGDHDLTSLAVAPLLAGTDIVVVDVDERLLAFIDRTARDQGLPITCVYADLTVALPASVAGTANVVVTDPPYTPAGVATFVARSIEALDARQVGRIVMAYGFGADHPTLGLQVQRQLIALELAIEAIEPGFNRYHGAQAIGSRSDLYTMIPTARSPRAASKLLAAATQSIYTHGDRSLEARTATLSGTMADAVLTRAGGDGPPPEALSTTRQLFDQVGRRGAGPVAASLLDGADAWLGRALLAATAHRLALLVPNAHPDIADAASQAALSALVAGRYDLTFLRSQPTDRTAIVVAERVGQSPPTLLDRPAASLRTALHDLLYKGSRQHGAGWSKPEVTTLVDELLAELGPGYAAIGVADLPRPVIVTAAQLAADRAARTSGSCP